MIVVKVGDHDAVVLDRATDLDIVCTGGTINQALIASGDARRISPDAADQIIQRQSARGAKVLSSVHGAPGGVIVVRSVEVGGTA